MVIDNEIQARPVREVLQFRLYEHILRDVRPVFVHSPKHEGIPKTGRDWFVEIAGNASRTKDPVDFRKGLSMSQEVVRCREAKHYINRVV